jgi:S-DNA-T family DNA segregation ATPase FtsK/SpoIIIE
MAYNFDTAKPSRSASLRSFTGLVARDQLALRKRRMPLVVRLALWLVFLGPRLLLWSWRRSRTFTAVGILGLLAASSASTPQRALYLAFAALVVALRYQDRWVHLAPPSVGSFVAAFPGSRFLTARSERGRQRALLDYWNARLYEAGTSLGLVYRTADELGNQVLAAPHVLAVEELRGGNARLSVALPWGVTPSKMQGATEGIAGVLGANAVIVQPDEDAGSTDRVTLVVVLGTDPLLDPAGLDPVEHPNPVLSMEPGSDPLGGVPLGVDTTSEVVWLPLFEGGILIGGLPGGGKSVAEAQLNAAASLMRDLELWLWDPKRVEFALWRARATRCVTGPDMEPAMAQLDDLLAEMDRRYAYLEGIGETKLPPSREWPLIVAVIDELAFYTDGDDGKASKEFSTKLTRLLAMSRAAGIVLVVATQKPSSEVVPTKLRDLFKYRLAFRTGNSAHSDTILGQGLAAKGFDASRLPNKARGLGYVLGESEALPVRFRGYFPQLSDRKRIAAASVVMRPVDRYALNEASADVDLSSGSAVEPTLGDPPRCADHTCLPLRDLPAHECVNCAAIWRQFGYDGQEAV